MPRVLRKAKRRSAGYTEWHILHLREGHEIFEGTAFGHGELFNEAAAREAWGILRETILADWIREQPGTRPWAWWWFDAPAPAHRERADDGVHPFDNGARKLYIANSNSECLCKAGYNLSFGLPGAFIPPFDTGLSVDSYEPEWSFLVRHNLLLPEDSPEFLAPTEDK